MFQIGDIITGTDPHHYDITNSSMIRGKVININRSRKKDIKVRVLEHKNRVWECGEHWVCSEYFELVEPPIEISITADELFELLNVHK